MIRGASTIKVSTVAGTAITDSRFRIGQNTRMPEDAVGRQDSIIQRQTETRPNRGCRSGRLRRLHPAGSRPQCHRYPDAVLRQGRHPRKTAHVLIGKEGDAVIAYRDMMPRPAWNPAGSGCEKRAPFGNSNKEPDPPGKAGPPSVRGGESISCRLSKSVGRSRNSTLNRSTGPVMVGITPRTLGAASCPRRGR